MVQRCLYIHYYKGKLCQRVQLLLVQAQLRLAQVQLRRLRHLRLVQAQLLD